jgi:hypothetical protein
VDCSSTPNAPIAQNRPSGWRQTSRAVIVSVDCAAWDSQQRAAWVKEGLRQPPIPRGSLAEYALRFQRETSLRTTSANSFRGERRPLVVLRARLCSPLVQQVQCSIDHRHRNAARRSPLHAESVVVVGLERARVANKDVGKGLRAVRNEAGNAGLHRCFGDVINENAEPNGSAPDCRAERRRNLIQRAARPEKAWHVAPAFGRSRGIGRSPLRGLAVKRAAERASSGEHGEWSDGRDSRDANEGEKPRVVSQRVIGASFDSSTG